MQKYCGTINANPIFGADALTLLFDSVVIAPYGDWQGNNIYDVHLFFNYRENPWNTAISGDGSWLPIQYNNGGNPPLFKSSFEEWINGLIPPNE